MRYRASGTSCLSSKDDVQCVSGGEPGYARTPPLRPLVYVSNLRSHASFTTRISCAHEEEPINRKSQSKRPEAAKHAEAGDLL